MTNVYFVRHAESDHSVHDEKSRPLTPKGMQDRALVNAYLANKEISAVFSSPYKRAHDTVAGFAAQNGLDVLCVDGFTERRVADVWIEDFNTYAKRQWADFTYKLPGGESLGEVQTRNIATLREVLAAHPNEAVVIGTHGTALSTIVNFYDPAFNHRSFMEIIALMPWIVHFQFDGDTCVFIESINPFKP